MCDPVICFYELYGRISKEVKRGRIELSTRPMVGEFVWVDDVYYEIKKIRHTTEYIVLELTA